MQNIRVGFDISQLAHTGGVATYARRLTEQLAKIDELEMTYFYSSLRRSYRGKLRNVKKYHFPPTFFEAMFNKYRIINIEKFIGEIDVFHSSDWTQPPTKAKKVTTYHDVIPLLFPQWSDPKIVEVQKRRLKIVEREIDMVIAVSECTKKDLLKISNIPADKIIVISEGPSIEYQQVSDLQKNEFMQKHNLPKDFILAMGGIGERKNLKRIREAAKDYNLVIPGETCKYISEEDLPALYSSAKVLLYPSLYEGFGLPVIDSMLYGLPVITSRNSSLAEVGGDAVLYTDPEDAGVMRGDLNRLMTGENLRKDLIKKGKLQANKFSWEKTANETKAVYQTLVS